MMNAKRLLAALVLLTLAFGSATLAVNSKPASADSYQRDRSASSRWMPQQGTVGASYYNSIYTQMVYEFRWSDYVHQVEANGNHRGLKFKAALSNGNLGDQHGPVSASWDNFPNGSYGSLDTQFGDSGVILGYIAGNANGFAVGPWYQAGWLAYKTIIGTGPTNVHWYVTAGTYKSHGETALGWLTCNALGIHSFCLFSDYQNTVIPAKHFSLTNNPGTSAYSGWFHNFLQNESTESGWFPWSAGVSGMNHIVYCGWDGYLSSCFYEFNRGTAAFASVQQDVYMATGPGDVFTGEWVVRCRPGANCPIALAIWGLTGGPYEHSVAYAVLPGDNLWYQCRVDTKHGAIPFASGHSLVRFELYQYGAGNIDFDYAHMGRELRYSQGAAYDTGWVQTGPVCELAGQRH